MCAKSSLLDREFRRNVFRNPTNADAEQPTGGISRPIRMTEVLYDDDYVWMLDGLAISAASEGLQRIHIIRVLTKTK